MREDTKNLGNGGAELFRWDRVVDGTTAVAFVETPAIWGSCRFRRARQVPANGPTGESPVPLRQRLGRFHL